NGASAVGKCARAGGMGPDAPCTQIVGVAADARYADITREPQPFFYRPLGQRPRGGPSFSVLHVRATGDPSAIVAAVRREMQALDASVPFVQVRPLTALIEPQLVPWRIGTLVFALFGVLGLLLS